MYDVIIAGAGPVGLFLACELGLRDVSVLVLEKMDDLHTPLKEGWMGMRGLNFPSVAAFYRRGMLSDVRKTALAWMEPNSTAGIKTEGEAKSPQSQRFAGHFAGIMLDAAKIDMSHQRYVTAGPSATGGMVSLEGIEELLSARAEALGVDIRRGMAVTGFDQNGSEVTVQAGGEMFTAGWLVGCDGGRSVVRKLAGFEFAGTDPEFTGYTVSAKLVDPEKLKPGFNLTPTGMYLLGPGPTRIGMADFDGAARDRSQQPTLEEVQEVLRRVSGTDVTIGDLYLASTYTDRARQAMEYRKGRVLLAGDAAHIHSPLGGQGLNTGLSDAMNLGWKLAATVQEWAPAGLLDTYQAERHPAGAWTLEWSRAQVAIMRPDPHAHAIAKVVRELIQTKEATNYFIEKISGISLRYDVGEEHPLAGRSAPDLEFEDGTRLGELLKYGAAALVDLRGNPEVELLGRRWPGRLVYVSSKVKNDLGLSAFLVRPDGFVAWATDEAADVTTLNAAVRRWLGEPSI